MRRIGSGRVAGVVIVATLAAVVASSVAATAQSPGASSGPGPRAFIISLGADTPLLDDVFAKAAGWGTLDDTDARITLEADSLRFRLKKDDQSRWSWLTLPAAHPVLRMGVTADVGGGSGAAGPMCGSSGGGGRFFTGVVNNAGEWVLARVVGADTTVISRAPVGGLDLADGGLVTLALECAVTAGGDRLTFSVNGINVADVTDTESFGPFDRVGLYASVATQPFEVRFREGSVLGGEAYQPQVAVDPSPSTTPEASTAPNADATPTPAPVSSVTVAWTDRDLLVLAFGGLPSATYADAYAWWQDAGPRP